ncbi:MAG: hypothetical protein ABI539_12240 [Acidobacteriota bacterium]
MSDEHLEKKSSFDRQLICLVCGNETFWQREEILAPASIFGATAGNPTATCMVCDECGFIHFFYPLNQPHR